MTIAVDRDARTLAGARTARRATLVFPLESTILELEVGEASHRLDRATFALVPARTPYTLHAGAGAVAVVALAPSDDVLADAARDYAPHVDARRFRTLAARFAVLARTRWVDEIVHRYVFERVVCEHATSLAARFLEVELVKEVYFLALEASDRRTRASVVYQGDVVAVRARAWLDDHLFEPFEAAALARHCGASASTVLRAFRKEHGVAPLAYLRTRRLDEAAQLLATGRYGVTEVATRVGYENPSAFAVAFRTRFGVAPSRARAVPDAGATLPAHGLPPKPPDLARRPRRRD